MLSFVPRRLEEVAEDRVDFEEETGKAEVDLELEEDFEEVAVEEDLGVAVALHVKPEFVYNL